jgi:predicted enzyme related to lactoylglutathione lyase
MPKIAGPLTNRPVWFDLSTSDLDAAKACYGELFGWTFESFGPEMGHYTMAFLDGVPAAALVPKQPGDDATPTAWTVYFGVSDVDATVARITAHGGSMLFPAMDVPGQGRMAIARDPEGAVFGLWQANPFPGAGVEGEPGAMCWCEVNSTNAAANGGFYGKIFDLAPTRMDASPIEYYTLDASDGQPVAGVLQMDENWAGIPSHWMPYFAVADLAKADATFTRHGGTLLHGPIPSPYGTIMVGRDKQGAVLSYMAAN